MRITCNTTSADSYRTFLRVKQLPTYRVSGRTVVFPDEYASRIGVKVKQAKPIAYQPSGFLFDYQRDIVRMAVEKRKFCIFADCGLGKTAMFLEFARHARRAIRKHQIVLIVSPLMVIPQTVDEANKFYGGDAGIEIVGAATLSQRLCENRGGIVITNYDSLKDDTPQGNIGALILDESSMLKSHYGKWGQKCLDLGKGLDWKLACTGTPAPNDRIEYANHAVLMDAFPTVNSFLARYFVNRGETGERWELKPHALRPFYRSLSHWSIFLCNPATYGWKDNCGTLPPINIHIHDVELTKAQQELAYQTGGQLFANTAGGITSRSVMGQIAKGNHRGNRIDTNKPEYIRNLISTWPDESTLTWCIYNEEQRILEEYMPDAMSMDGTTELDERNRMVADFKAGRNKHMISKAKILGFGLNLQIATRMVFSGLQDSYENYYQCIKRANRIGSTRPLNVHIPITDIERPMVETVLTKAKRVQHDTEQQEQIFKEASNV
jgi:superfamily II DNA or RNA helicase